MISCAASSHSLALPASPMTSASLAPRSAATQHMILEEVKCFSSPRTSQMPASGSRQCLRAWVTCFSKIGQTRLSR